MRRARILRAGATTLLALLAATSTGCIHNHYYGTAAGMPVCTSGPAGPTEVAVVPYGAICEVPSSRVEGGTVVAQSPAQSPAAAPAPAAVAQAPQSRVLVSQPRFANRPWRRTDPEGGLATTRVEGGLDDTLSR